MEDDEQITHQIQLDQELDVQDSLSKLDIFSILLIARLQRLDFFFLTDIYMVDPEYLENEI